MPQHDAPSEHDAGTTTGHRDLTELYIEPYEEGLRHWDLAGLREYCTVEGSHYLETRSFINPLDARLGANNPRVEARSATDSTSDRENRNGYPHCGSAPD